MTSDAQLARRLQQPAEAGIHRLPPGDAQATAAAAQALGYAVFHVDMDACADKAALLARIAAALRFPDWFGHNWDALADCLGDMSWRPATGYVIFLDHADRLPAGAVADFAIALDVCADVARELAREGRLMWIVVAGGGGPPSP
jgi:RNAse (barnase) inhibitor barstar